MRILEVVTLSALTAPPCPAPPRRPAPQLPGAPSTLKPGEYQMSQFCIEPMSFEVSPVKSQCCLSQMSQLCIEPISFEVSPFSLRKAIFPLLLAPSGRQCLSACYATAPPLPLAGPAGRTPFSLSLARSLPAACFP